jgi:hypothetical protein
MRNYGHFLLAARVVTDLPDFTDFYWFLLFLLGQICGQNLGQVVVKFFVI